MPAAKVAMQKYIVTADPFCNNQKKGMWVWVQTKAATRDAEPEGDQIYVEAGTIVEMTPEAAQPLVDTGRLRLAE